MKIPKGEITLFSCVIVDDEEHSANELERLLLSFRQIRLITKVTDPHQAVTTIMETAPDLVFLDIQMPEMSGFEVLDAFNHMPVKPFVIFVTAFDQYAIRAIRCAAFDYLLKPVDKNELTMALERFMTKSIQQELEIKYASLLEQTSGRKIRFNTTGGFILIDPREIIYIQADWNYSEIYLNKDKREVVALNLGAVEAILPPGSFARINRSVIINLLYIDRVHRIKRLCILKKDGESYDFKIPIMRIRYLEKLL